MAQIETDHEFVSMQAGALVEHYQKNRKTMSRSWEQRNRRYIFLICLLAVAALLSFVQGPVVQALAQLSANELSTLIGKLSTLNSLEVASIVASFLVYNASVVFDLLMIVFLVAVFYLTADLFHRSSMLVSSYVYLALMEAEIRTVLRLSDEFVAFTKESSFYKATGRRLSFLIGAANKGMLGCLLVAFFASRLLGDYPRDGLPLGVPTPADLGPWLLWARKNFLFLLDVLTAGLTMPLFWGYLTLKPPSESELREAMTKAAHQL